MGENDLDEPCGEDVLPNTSHALTETALSVSDIKKEVQLEFINDTVEMEPLITEEIELKTEVLSPYPGTQNDAEEQPYQYNNLLEDDVHKLVRKCELCKYSTTKEDNFQQHLKKHEMKPTVNSRNRPKYNPYKTEEWHKTSQNKILRVLKCTHCDYVTCWQTSIMRHVASHNEDKPFECNQCGYKCSHKDRLKKHLYNHLKPFVCNECGYKAASNAYLLQHVRIHTTDKLLKCQLCDYKTAWNYSLNRHVRIHSVKQVLKCKECEYTATHKRLLHTHMVGHTTSGAYECYECHYKTSCKNTLKRHVMIHTLEKPYKCNYCKYCTNRKHHLKRHMQKIHPDKCL